MTPCIAWRHITYTCSSKKGTCPSHLGLTLRQDLIQHLLIEAREELDQLAFGITGKRLDCKSDCKKSG